MPLEDIKLYATGKGLTPTHLIDEGVKRFGSEQGLYDFLQKQPDFQSTVSRVAGIASGTIAGSLPQQGGQQAFQTLSSLFGEPVEKFTMNPTAYGKWQQTQNAPKPPAETYQQMLDRLAKGAEANRVADEALYGKQTMSLTGLPQEPTQPQAFQTFAGGNRATPSIVDFLSSVGQPSDFATRSKLAQLAGIQNYKGTAEQNTELLKKLRSTPTPATSSVTPEKLAPAEKIKISPLPVVEESREVLTDAQRAQADIQARLDLYKATQTAEQKQEEALFKEEQKSIGELAGKSAYTTQKTKELVDPLQAQLTQTNNEINTLVEEKNRLIADLEGKPITMSSIIGAQAQVGRVLDSKILSATARANALMGNIERAQQQVDRAVEAKYGAIEEKIAIAEAQRKAIEPLLTKQEKMQAEALSIIDEQRKQQLADKKAEEKAIQNVVIDYIKAGGDDPNVIDQISKTKNLNDALKLLLPVLTTKDEDTGNWTMFQNENGDYMVFDKNTGTIKPAEGQMATGQNYFTDANGVSWNLEGWATDPTKAQQMQTISNQIGKLDDTNLESKVKQFAPGLTADMIRSTSAKTGVSWEALLTMAVQESNGGTSPVAMKNNNFAGLTFNNQEWIKAYGGVKGTARPASEGGNYISFPTKQAGLDAMGALMANYGTVVPKEQAVDSEVQAYVQRVNSGALTDAQALTEIDKTKKKALVEALAKTPKPSDDPSVLEAKDKINEIESLIKSSALNDAVGTNFFGRDWSMFDASKISGDYQAFIGGVSLLTDQLTLDKLVESKARGATFGALSERELQMLANSATKIGSWAVKKKDGTVKGYNIDEDSFRKELDTIKLFYQRDVERKGGSNYRTMNDDSVWQINPDGTLTQL